MKIRVNHNNNDLWCLYYKELIEIGEQYIEVAEDYGGEELVKTYKYECLNMLVAEHLENYDTEPEIDFGAE